MRFNKVNCWVLGHNNHRQGGRVAGKQPRGKGPEGVGHQQLNMSQCVPRHTGLHQK